MVPRGHREIRTYVRSLARSFETALGAAQEAILLWFLVLKPPKTGTSADRFGGPALVLHGIYIRGKATGAIFDGLATRNHKVGSFETALGAAQEEGNSVVVNCTKPLQNRGDKHLPIALAARH